MVEAARERREACRHCVPRQHEGGHRSGAAGHGRDRPGASQERFVIGIADDAIPDDVDAEVHDDGARLDHVAGNQSGMTGGDTDQVSLPHDARQVDGSPVADGDCGVPLEEQRGEGTTDDITSSYHDGSLPLDRDAVMVEQLDSSLRRARPERRQTEVKPARVRRGDSVDVFEWREVLVDNRHRHLRR